jgi:hypothetical protein
MALGAFRQPLHAVKLAAPLKKIIQCLRHDEEARFGRAIRGKVLGGQLPTVDPRLHGGDADAQQPRDLRARQGTAVGDWPVGSS